MNSCRPSLLLLILPLSHLPALHCVVFGFCLLSPTLRQRHGGDAGGSAGSLALALAPGCMAFHGNTRSCLAFPVCPWSPPLYGSFKPSAPCSLPARGCSGPSWLLSFIRECLQSHGCRPVVQCGETRLTPRFLCHRLLGSAWLRAPLAVGTGLYKMPLAMCVISGCQTIERPSSKQGKADSGLGSHPSLSTWV